MNIEAITTELFKLLSLEKQSSYTSDIEERNKHKIKYSIYNEYYFAANRDNSFSYVFGLKDKVLKTAIEHEEKYKEL